jgi:hypothetical protein
MSRENAEDGRPPLPKSGSRPRQVTVTYRRSTDTNRRATDLRTYRQSTDFGRVRGNGHSSTVYSPATYGLCHVPGTSTVTTVDNADSR